MGFLCKVNGTHRHKFHIRTRYYPRNDDIGCRRKIRGDRDRHMRGISEDGVGEAARLCFCFLFHVPFLFLISSILPLRIGGRLKLGT